MRRFITVYLSALSTKPVLPRLRIRRQLPLSKEIVLFWVARNDCHMCSGHKVSVEVDGNAGSDRSATSTIVVRHNRHDAGFEAGVKFGQVFLRKPSTGNNDQDESNG